MADVIAPDIKDLFDAFEHAEVVRYDAEQALLALLPKDATERVAALYAFMATVGYRHEGAMLLLIRAESAVRREAALARIKAAT